MSAHTPGPWIIDPSSDGRGRGYIREAAPTEDSRHIAVARVTDGVRRRSETDANARLIAAAPDLLEALEFACGGMSLMGELCGKQDKAAVFLRKMRAAIAKATEAV